MKLCSIQVASSIDIFGTFAFVVSGAFFAMEKRFDPFVVLILSLLLRLLAVKYKWGLPAFYAKNK
ncbi:hypothetical protein BH11BAC4_BH11BAC4_20920 [soil metagenome]